MSLTNQPAADFLDGVYKEFGTSRVRVLGDIQTLKAWLNEQPHLPKIENDVFFENMMLRSKCSVERTKQALDMHFTIKTAAPEFFCDRDPLSKNIQAAVSYFDIDRLTNLTSDGYHVAICRCRNAVDLTDFNLQAALKAGLMLFDQSLYRDLTVGDVVILDAKHLSAGHLTSFSLPMLKKFVVIFLQGYKSRLKSIHFLHGPPLLDTVIKIMKPMLKSKIIARIHVHPNLHSLHKHVDRNMLPKEYGGDQNLEFDGLNGIKVLTSHRDWFLAQDIVGKVDESKRPGKRVSSSELFGIEGSFKKLDVD